MTQPAIISLIWGKNISVLECFLKKKGPCTILTLSGFIDQKMADVIERAGGTIVLLDQQILYEKDVKPFLSDLMSGFEDKLKNINFVINSDDVKYSRIKLIDVVEECMASELPLVTNLLNSLEWARVNFNVSLLLVNEDLTNVGRPATLWAKAHTIPSLHLAHSISLADPYTVHSKLLADKLAVFCSRGMEGYLDLGIPSERMCITGNPAWDVYQTLCKNKKELLSAFVDKYHLKGDIPIVVFATTWSANLSAFCNENIFSETLTSFIYACHDLHKEGFVFNAIIKDRVSNLAYGNKKLNDLCLSMNIDPSLFIYTLEDSEGWAVVADVLIAVDSNYTVEAMICGTPCINLLCSAGGLYGGAFEVESGVVEVEAGELASAIQELLSNKSFRDVHLNQTKLRLPHYHFSGAGTAAERVAGLMLEMVHKNGPVNATQYVWQQYLDVEELDVNSYYHDSARKELIGMFSNNPRIVLDIGCAAGANGELLKKQYPECQVWGVETSRSAAKIASERLDRVLVGKFEEFDFEKEGLLKGSLDGVILADVLEHMYNPWSVMTALQPYLSPTAQVIISIPNVRNLKLMEDLADGFWRYDSAGLLDITHIRFFTLKEFNRFLDETGYNVRVLNYTIDQRLMSVYEANKNKQIMDLELGRMKLSAVNNEELLELCSLQFYIVATAKEGAAPLLPVVQLDPYEQFLDHRYLSTSEARHFDMAMGYLGEAGISQFNYPILKILILDRYGDLDAIVRTIKSITGQLYKNISFSVVSITQNPMPTSEINWIKCQNNVYVEALAYSASLDDDYIGFLEGGDLFTVTGLLLAVQKIVENFHWDLIYMDDDILNEKMSPSNPRFKPDLNLDLLRSMPYADGFIVIRRLAMNGINWQDLEGDGAEQVDLILRVLDTSGPQSIGHVAEIVCHLQLNDARALGSELRQLAFAKAVHAHLQRWQVDAELLLGARVEGSLRIVYQHETQPLVSILIPSKDQLGMLQRCVESLLEKTTYLSYEIIIIDNQSETLQAKAYLSSLALICEEKIRVISYPHAFNFSAMNNMAVNEAKGEYLVLLNNDTAIVEGDWLQSMLHHAQRPEVGVVGAKLLYPTGLVQHAGVVLGLRGPADHPCLGTTLEDSGYMHRLQLDQNYSAVTAACLMIRKSVYEQAGGMDEVDFKVSYNDVDLCLKVGKLGYLTVWTPYAVVMHEGSVSQNAVDPDLAVAKQKRFEGEQTAMYNKWLFEIGNDPAYNKNLTLSGAGFELEQRSLLTWQPLSWRPVPSVLCHPADQMGCGRYRIFQPFAALEDELKISGVIALELYPVFELAKLAPDVIVYQRQITEGQIDFLRRSKLCSPAFKIYELDDYLPNLPLKSAHREHMPKDIVKSLRKALTFVDRFVVSTSELANAYQSMHTQIHVVNNYLPVSIWGTLSAARRVGEKPRVGWAGGISHTGDLELIASVVQALAAEVEWVFFGMCPDKLRPFVHEFHSGVPIEHYPSKLASLNLDLALAPLEHNTFNLCKSNLRLLEYGACGFPVICTDIAPYLGDLPVTRVKNKHKDWVDAIRDHLADLDAAAECGDALKAEVLKSWMLEGDNLERWREAWLPS
ncbi:glycosyltransferase [Iodobacter arcticus]|uniref:Glycosyltransferase n=1 Tax=Iodobacter arcticus TaxID=590593 RepID=A0ABW2QVV7_9NEIS